MVRPPAAKFSCSGLSHRVGLVLTGCVALLGLAFLVAAGIPTLLGLDVFVATGGSMEPTIRKGSVVVAKRVDPAQVTPGDIITYSRARSPEMRVTHRVVSVEQGDGVPVLRTKGDANGFLDPKPVGFSQPVSRMVYTIPYAGYLLNAARSPLGILAFIVAPAAFLFFGGMGWPRFPSWRRRGERQLPLPLSWR